MERISRYESQVIRKCLSCVFQAAQVMSLYSGDLEADAKGKTILKDELVSIYPILIDGGLQTAYVSFSYIPKQL